MRKSILKETAPKKETTATLPTTAPVDTKQPQNISLDQKVDAFFIKYEKEALPSMQKEIFVVKDFLHFLFEADEPAPPTPPDAPGDLGGGDLGDMGGPPDMGGSDPGTEGEEEKETPSATVNINIFAERLARLVENFENLVNPKLIILNRAQAYITKNYKESVAKELMIHLELNYNLSQKTLTEKETSAPPAPYAYAAEGTPEAGPTGGP